MGDRRLALKNFDETQPLITTRAMTIDGEEVHAGKPLPDKIALGMRMRLWKSRRVVYERDYRPSPVIDPALEARTLVVVEAIGGGWFMITAPWLAEPVKVQGEEAANARADELRERGDDKGVAITGGDGGWFVVSAPWIAEGEKVQGREAAETREAELIAEGPPQGWVPGQTAPVDLIGGDPFEASYEIGGATVPLGDIVASAHKAAGITAEAWNELTTDARNGLIENDLNARLAAVPAPDPDSAAPGEGGEAAEEGAESKPTVPVAELTEDGSNGWYQISAPWLADPVRVRGQEKADAELARINEEGPPADWVAPPAE